MADNKSNTKETGKAKGTEKVTDKQVRKSQTIADLKAMGKKGSLIILARLSYAIAQVESENKDKKKVTFAGTKWEGRKLEDVAGTFYQKVGPKGPLATLPEDSEQIKGLLTLAKAAKDNISKQQNTNAVKMFLDAVINTSAGTGVRTRDFGIASDLVL